MGTRQAGKQKRFSVFGMMKIIFFLAAMVAHAAAVCTSETKDNEMIYSGCSMKQIIEKVKTEVNAIKAVTCKDGKKCLTIDDKTGELTVNIPYATCPSSKETAKGTKSNYALGSAKNAADVKQVAGKPKLEPFPQCIKFSTAAADNKAVHTLKRYMSTVGVLNGCITGFAGSGACNAGKPPCKASPRTDWSTTGKCDAKASDGNYASWCEVSGHRTQFLKEQLGMTDNKNLYAEGVFIKKAPGVAIKITPAINVAALTSLTTDAQKSTKTMCDAFLDEIVAKS